ncbi:NAD(P)H-binding [Lacrimispora sphenoides]|jgi:NADH dehydrogenase|uniref:NAD-dependent epimerase/dehydratase family protein n=1 Tax=Lacrimispora sphenoides TaxID=29370 RepID=UPI0008CF2310|nr:NAD(P)-dependent oxidoreductase [Lacrimispora sphenoides]SET55003.1 NAD(P)H-binding [Lacrimispora sphenoides]
MKKVILIGGSGYIGTHLMEQWLQKDSKVEFISISRSGKPEKLPERIVKNAKVKWMSADIFNVDSYIGQLPEKADAIVDLVGTATAKTQEEFEKLNVEPVKVMVELMERLSIPKGCYISGMMGMPGTGKLFIDSKRKGEAVAKASKKEIGIVRPSLVYGDRSGVGAMVFFVKLMGAFKKDLRPIKVEQLADQIIRICR